MDGGASPPPATADHQRDVWKTCTEKRKTNTIKTKESAQKNPQSDSDIL